MKVTTVSGGPTHGQLAATAELVASILDVGAVSPLVAVVRLHPEGQGIEGIYDIGSKHLVAELRRSVVSLEEHPKRLFQGESKAAKRPALNADPTVDLEIVDPVRIGWIDQLQ